jgi:hypothetical protein
MSKARTSSRLLGAAALLLLAACAEGPTSIAAPAAGKTVNAIVAGLASSAPSRNVIGGPDLSDYKTFQGEIYICKDGNQTGAAFNFDYEVVRQSDNVVVAQGSATVPVGQCVLAANVSTETPGRYKASATETSVVANWSLTDIDWAYGSNLPISPPAPTIDIPTRTISAVLLSNDIGVQLTFTNQYVAPPTGEIGDFVWYDVNGNGVQESGEPGIAGVTVTLGGASSATATTDANGAYLFGGLAAGSYTVTVGTPAGYVPTLSNAGGDANLDSNGSPAAVTLATDASVNRSIDFGYTKGTGKIGDRVWNDANGNGIQDGGEAGIAGVTVTLGGAASATTTTDASGNYLFSGLLAGAYTVSVATPAGFTPTAAIAGPDRAVDSNGSPTNVTLASNNAVDLTIDFGFTKPSGKIGDLVWYDKDRDGIQDWGEYGMSGVVVTLSGPVNATTTTNSQGAYLFSNLPAGNYTVTVGTPTGYVASPSLRGSNRNVDSNGSPASVVLATNSSVDLSIDFGFDKPTVVPCVQPTTWWISNWWEWNSSSDGRPIWKTQSFYNSGKSMWDMISMSTKSGNAYVILAQELITAKLVKHTYESTGSASVDAAIAGAEAWFAAHPAGISTPTGATYTQLMAWANTLDKWTDGNLGTRVCSGNCR